MAEDFSDQFLGEDIVRICNQCEKEQKLDQKILSDNGWRLSHGGCLRHLAETMKTANIDAETIKKFVEKKREQPPLRDLSDPKNKPLVDWLKNPPMNYSKHEKDQEQPAE